MTLQKYVQVIGTGWQNLMRERDVALWQPCRRAGA